MKKAVFFLICLFCADSLLAQNKSDSLVEVFYYDSLGNEYHTGHFVKAQPTNEIDPIREIIKKMNDSLYGKKTYVFPAYTLESENKLAPLFPREEKHLFALHWIGYGDFGSVIIKKKSKKLFSIKGAQRNNRGDYVTIEGVLIPVNKGTMIFDGKLVTKCSGNYGGKPCVRKGKSTFYSKSGRRYWRLVEMYNCEAEGLVDYVDIFF